MDNNCELRIHMRNTKNNNMTISIGGADSAKGLSLNKDSAYKTHLCDKINIQRITDD
jgi:hypothetical protein